MKDYLARTNPWPYPITIESANGSYFETKEYGAMFDMACGIAVNNLGHNHPKIRQAVKSVTDRYAHTMVYGEFYIQEQLDFAQRLAQQFNTMSMSNGTGHENRVWFTVAGTEANELAMKLATLATGREGFIALKNGFHGRSLGSLSITYKPMYREPFAYMVNPELTKWIEPGDEIPEEYGQRAAFFMELVQGEAGVIPLDPEWVAYVSKWCKDHGVLLVIDEVQTGFGRSGTQFALDHYKNAYPDIITLGKAIGGGYPLGAVVASKELFDNITEKNPFTHLSTFGGNPVGCAAGLVVLQETGNKKFLEQVQQGEKIAREVFDDFEPAHIRGKGLMLGLVLEDSIDIDTVVNKIWENRVFCGRVLYASNTIRLYPPLNSTQSDLYNKFGRVRDAVEKSIK